MTNVPLTRFGAELRRRRKRKGLGQVALAAAVGVSPHAIHQVESGKTREPSLMTALRLCLALDMTPNEMAACFGMWHGRALDNDKLSGRLAQALADLEDAGQRLGARDQMRMEDVLHGPVLTFREWARRTEGEGSGTESPPIPP